MTVREAVSDDYDSIWDIFEKVIKTGDTYVFDSDTQKQDLLKHWFAPNMKTYVLEEDNKVLGTYFIKPNQIDLGSHISNCGYMVHPNYQGKGIGKILCKHSLEIAKELGYMAMQFNIVVSTNKKAVQLWEYFGFKIIGTIPKGFKHLQLGYVDAFIMYKAL